MRSRRARISCGRSHNYVTNLLKVRSMIVPALTREWDSSPSHGKIILGASDTEFERVKLENPHHFLVVDLGHTEVETQHRDHGRDVADAQEPEDGPPEEAPATVEIVPSE